MHPGLVLFLILTALDDCLCLFQTISMRFPWVLSQDDKQTVAFSFCLLRFCLFWCAVHRIIVPNI